MPRLDFELADLDGPNNAFGNSDRLRFGRVPLAVAGPNQIRSLGEFLDPKRPIVLICDEALLDFLDAQLVLGKADMTLTVHSEPYQQDVKVLASALDDVATCNLVAVGGDSTLDTAKALRSLRTYGSNMNMGYGPARRAADFSQPVDWLVAVPALPGSGAESSRYFVLKDSEERKVPGRAWNLLPDVVLMDASLVLEAPERNLVMSAFDAFVHGWETYITRGESTEFSRLMSYRGMELSLRGIETLFSKGKCLKAAFELLEASYLGGVSLSNVRTGLIHTSGVALSSWLDVSHPNSLMVFSPLAASTYQIDEIDPPAFSLWQAGVDLWRRNWPVDIVIKSSSLPDLADHIVLAILDDQTLIEKTHPGFLSETGIREFALGSLSANVCS